MANDDKSRENRRAQNRERYAWLKEKGFCTMCGSTWNKPGYVLCETCLKRRAIYDNRFDPDGERHRTSNRERRVARAAAGRCTECGRPAEDGFKTCRRCRDMRMDCVRVYRIKKRIKQAARR